jgi:hypothetical protein
MVSRVILRKIILLRISQNEEVLPCVLSYNSVLLRQPEFILQAVIVPNFIIEELSPKKIQALRSVNA